MLAEPTEANVSEFVLKFLIFLSLFVISVSFGCSKTTTAVAPAELRDNDAASPTNATDKPNEGERGKVLTDSASIESAAGTSVRFATYNVSLYRKRARQLAEDLAGGKNQQAHKLATVIQHVRPDVILLNEFDYDKDGSAAASFAELYLGINHGDTQPIHYPYHYFNESNTGEPSGLDLDNDGKTNGPGDCFGYGRYPGQYGMLVLSKYPIKTEEVRTFRKFAWQDMPNAQLPVDPNSNAPYYSEDELDKFRLSSKSHWDVPIEVNGQTIHFLVCHPTPPVFDGDEDRNGKRNHDEIRLFADYVDPERSSYITDDSGKTGGLLPNAKFVIAGDLNADPNDGDSHSAAANLLLQHPMIQSVPIPSSAGPVEDAGKGSNAKHRGDPKNDTADFDDRGSGNLRIDYVLPSKTLTISDTGVFWPAKSDPLSQLINATDHRLVWIDLSVGP